MKRVVLGLIFFVSLPVFADRLIKEDFYFVNDSEVINSRMYRYGKNGDLEVIGQVNDDSGIYTEYIYEKKRLTEAKEYNDETLISHSFFLYHDEKSKAPYRRDVYDGLKKLKSYSLFTFEEDEKNPILIETFNDKNKLSERMVFVYSGDMLSEIQIFDENKELQLCRKQIFDEHKNAVKEEIILGGKVIRVIKREFSLSRKNNNKIFSLPDNFFDFK